MHKVKGWLYDLDMALYSGAIIVVLMSCLGSAGCLQKPQPLSPEITLSRIIHDAQRTKLQLLSDRASAISKQSDLTPQSAKMAWETALKDAQDLVDAAIGPAILKRMNESPASAVWSEISEGYKP